MLRIYCLQQWFNLSDPAAEEALYDILSMRRFVGIDLGREHLQAKGVRLSSGTIVDASIINAPSSTKNEQKARGPDMYQPKEGNQWYFGTKAHFGVDRQSKVIHAVVTTAANVHDSTVLGDLLRNMMESIVTETASAVSVSSAEMRVLCRRVSTVA